MDRRAQYLQAISNTYPDLVIETVRMHNRDGEFNDILIINDEFIFRFPRYGPGVATLVIEIAILKHIQPVVPIPVPNPIYISRDMQTVGRVFMGYRMLVGKPLWQETLAAIHDDAILHRLTTQLAEFLIALHAVPIEPLRAAVPVRDQLAVWSEMYTTVRQHLFPFMRPDVRTSISRHFESFLSTPRLHQYPLVLRHGDFGTGNILYNPTARMISGIIDFGSAGLGDPAIDIAAISGYGSTFFEEFCKAYPVSASMWERAQFYKGTYALQEALHGFLHNEREAFESGMAKYV